MTPGDDAAIALAQHAAGLYEPRNNLGGDWHLGDIRIKWHIFLTPSGNPVIDPDDLKPLIPLMNALYSDIGIGFCPDEEIDYIETPADWWPTVPEEDIDSLMALNDVEGAMDVYWANDLAGGILGKSSFTWSETDSIVLNAEDLSSESLRRGVFGHEIGHWFDLYHTHDSSMGEECVNGSNCEFTGDLLCDTAAAFNMNSCISSTCTLLTSCQGVDGPCGGDGYYDPDTRNCMAYLSPYWGCADNLSDGQYQRARGALENFRMDYVVPSCPTILGDETCVSVSAILPEGRNRIDGDAFPFGSGPEIATPQFRDDWLLGNQWFIFKASRDGVLTLSTEGYETVIAVYPRSYLTCPFSHNQVIASAARHDGVDGGQVHLQVLEDDEYLVRVGIRDDSALYEDYWVEAEIREFTTVVSTNHNLVEVCEAMPDDAILKLMPGFHNLDAPLVLAGKNLTLMGAIPTDSSPWPSIVRIPNGMPGVLLMETDFRTRFLNVQFNRVGAGEDTPGNIFIMNSYSAMPVAGGPLFQDCTFDGETNGVGGNVQIIGSEPLFSRCSFTGTAGATGGAIAVQPSSEENTSKPSFMACEFTGSASRGGGIALEAGAIGWFFDCDFDGCTATTDGGAIYSEGALECYECGFAYTARNSADGSGGAIAAGGGFVEISSCTFGGVWFSANTANGSGGAIAVSGPNTFLGLSKSTLYGNIASDGAGVAVLGGANVSLWKNEFTNNGTYATARGGAVFIEGAGTTVSSFSECTIENNQASQGGGAYLGAEVAITRIKNTTFRHNFGLYSPNYGSGGGLYIDGETTSGTLEIQDTLFENNRAATGGGALHTNAADLTVIDCVFDSNESLQDGKAMSVEGEATVTCSTSSVINHATVELPDEGSLFTVTKGSLVDFDGDLLCGNGPILKSGSGSVHIDSSVCDMSFCDLDADGILDCDDERIEFVPAGAPGAIEHAVEHSLLGTTFQLEAGVYAGKLPSYAVLNGDVRDCVFEGAVDENGQPATIFDGEEASVVMIVSYGASETTIFRNIIFQGGRATDGGGVLVFATAGDGPRFENCIFRDNRALNPDGGGYGGGVLIPLGEASFHACLFQFNHAGLSGGAIGIGSGAFALMADCVVELNEAAEAGGAMVNNGGELQLFATTFCGNTVTQIEGEYTSDKDSCIQEFCIQEGCSEPCSADFDGDGLIDGGDLGLLIAAFGLCEDCLEDLDGDGSVGGEDLGILLSNWGVVCE